MGYIHNDTICLLRCMKHMRSCPVDKCLHGECPVVSYITYSAYTYSFIGTVPLNHQFLRRRYSIHPSRLLMLTNSRCLFLLVVPCTIYCSQRTYLYIPPHPPHSAHTKPTAFQVPHFFIYQPWARQFGLNAQSVMVQEERPSPKAAPPAAGK